MTPPDPESDLGTSKAVAIDLAAHLEDAAGDPRVTALSSVRRVRKAYEQVADQLRSLIVSGRLNTGDRLPTEIALAKEFGVSRATVREALRTLAAQRLIVTTKGAGGGTYVASPGLDYISEFMHANISLLTEMNRITLDELLQAREHLEVFGARLVARRHAEVDLDHLSELIPSPDVETGKTERFGLNITFHGRLMELTGNKLLYLAALPLFSVLQTNLARSELSEKWHRDVTLQHDQIMEAMTAGDENAAGSLMQDHLAYLRPAYERAWRQVVRSHRVP